MHNQWSRLNPFFSDFIVKDGAKNVIRCTGEWVRRLEEENKRHTSIPPTPELTLDNLAFTVYSSGTTGKPKGQPL